MPGRLDGSFFLLGTFPPFRTGPGSTENSFSATMPGFHVASIRVLTPPSVLAVKARGPDREPRIPLEMSFSTMPPASRPETFADASSVVAFHISRASRLTCSPDSARAVFSSFAVPSREKDAAPPLRRANCFSPSCFKVSSKRVREPFSVRPVRAERCFQSCTSASSPPSRHGVFPSSSRIVNPPSAWIPPPRMDALRSAASSVPVRPRRMSQSVFRSILSPRRERPASRPPVRAMSEDSSFRLSRRA